MARSSGFRTFGALRLNEKEEEYEESCNRAEGDDPGGRPSCHGATTDDVYLSEKLTTRVTSEG